METGDLPSGTVISFHTGSVRRHAQIEKDKSINLSHVNGSEPVRVDVMSQVGTHTFDMVPGQDLYDVPIKPNPSAGIDSGLKLKFRIKYGAGVDGQNTQVTEECKNGSPSKKLQSALMMRNYLDDHDVVRQMQDVLQEMVASRPEDPIEYMIQRLENVCKDGQAVDYDVYEEKGGTVADMPSKAAKPADSDSDSESDGDDDEPDLPPPPPPSAVRKRGSVSEEAYGQFNERKAYVPKVVAKSEEQKQRLMNVMESCWMFKSHTPENKRVIVDALEERIIEAGVRCVQQGDEGQVMWVIEEGVLECLKVIGGEEKSVKVCKSGDIFGELALLYGCPRAASVVSKERCVLWELDRETFKAICFEAAKKAPVDYDGFSAPAASSSSSNADQGGPVKKTLPSRRTGVSAGALAAVGDDWTPPVYEKSQEERDQLSNIIKTSHDSKLLMLFGSVNKETFEKIVDAMFAKAIKAGEAVIEQGGEGDYFYIVKRGDFDIYVQKGQDPPKKVFQAGVGFAFGELALLYSCPRSATIKAQDDSEVWCLDREAFQNLVIRSAQSQFKEYCGFLSSVDLFQVLSDGERASLAGVLEEEEFDDDEAIVEQGEKDDKMFILRSGQACACIKGEQGEVEVMQYKTGDYFGEIALLSGEPRKASVYAVGKVTCLYITRDTFVRVLGNLHSVLERSMGKYEKYHDAIKASKDETATTVVADDHEGDEYEGGTEDKKAKFTHRKRERKAMDLSKLDQHKVVSELQAEDAPVETLADKVAQDFKNPALVTPSESHTVKDALITMFGGLAPHQKFTMDKVIHVVGGLTASKKNTEDFYSWSMPSKLKQTTEISVVCQKGQKSASDPTPNQDNFFIHHVGAVTMYGICDGHGPFGHLVSFRLVQTLPFFLSNSPHFGKDWEQALKQAFQEAQDDLKAFCELHGVNIEASGAAGSVLVLEDQTIHCAHIGDARIMLGSWNRRDSRMIHCTKDHKPDLPEEKARLHAAGSEVREIDPGNHRIYLPGSSFPGLTMSRAFGDTACAGVSVEPEYHQFLMQPTDQWYAIVASDGIWEFMDGEEACNLSSKKLRLKGTRETVEFMVSASRKRWAHVCGDYCDDITAILIQWNSATALEGGCNHSLTVRPWEAK